MTTKTMEIVFSDWAKFYTIDRDGWIFEWDEEPERNAFVWIPVGMNYAKIARTIPPADWTTELHRIER